MAQVLLFNIGAEKKKKIRFLLVKLGAACREVPPEDFGRTLGELTGREGAVPADEAPEPFSGEMLVMDGFGPDMLRGLLDGLRRVKAPVALKAVVTEQNLEWTASRLHAELLAEHEAMKRGENAHGG
jgi:hypothetical protein